MALSIEESTTEFVPPFLQEAVQQVLIEGKCSDSLQKDLLYVLIISLMIESKCFPIRNEKDIIEDVKSINAHQLSKWKTPQEVLNVKFVMRECDNLPMKLIISPLGATVLVNLIIDDLDSETYSVCLPLGRYVVSPRASSIPMIFRDLKHLSVTFKNKILTPAKSRIMGYLGYPSASLVGLPDEVLYKIFLCMGVQEVVRLAQTCRKMKYFLDKESLWHELFLRDFENAPSECSDWKALYQEKYTQQMEAALVRRGRQAGAMHDYMDYSDHVSYIDNPFWSSMII